MEAAGRTNQNQSESELRTLGDLLYTDKNRARLTEKTWVSLVRSIAGGDQVALQSLYEQTHRLAFTLILRITNNRESAEEVTLDVFHDVWRRASAYDPANGSVVGWIMNQARSRAVDRLRFEQRKKRINSYADNPVTTATERDPQQACCFEEQSLILRNALAVLTPEEQQVIETTFFSEMTHQEAAAKLDQPLGTVKSRIRSGLAKLRQALTKTRKGI